MRKPNPEEWRPIDFTDKYASGDVWIRLEMLMDFDPFTSMFSKEAKRGLLLLVCTTLAGGEATGGPVVYNTLTDINMVVRDALAKSAMGMMLTPQFITHFISLVGTAVLAGKE